MLVGCLLLTACPPLPPERPLGPCPLERLADGRCPVDDYNEQVRCFRMHELREPRTVEKLQEYVRAAVKEGERLRARGAGHSTTTGICTAGTGVDMRKLRPDDFTKRLVMRRENGKLIAEAWAGMPLYELAERVSAAGASIGFSMIGFREVTVGGALANGAHGSSLTESTLLASRVRGVTLVDAEGALWHYRFDGKNVLRRPGTPEIQPPSTEGEHAMDLDEAGIEPADFWHALLGNLGMLGFVVRVEVEVDERYWLWVRVHKHARDDKLWSDPESLLSDGDVLPARLPGAHDRAARCDFFQVLWYPHARDQIERPHGRMITMCGVKVYRRELDDPALQQLADGKLGKDAFVSADVLETPEETEQYIDSIYADGGPLEYKRVGKRRVAQHSERYQRAVEKQQQLQTTRLHGRNAIDVDNAALNPQFRGFFANFASQAHEFMNWAWPFDPKDSLFTRHCSFVENQRFAGSVFALKSGKAIFLDDFAVLGWPHRLVSSGLANEGHKVTQVDYELSISQPEWKAALKEFHDEIVGQTLCMPMTGVFVRFSRIDSSTLLTHNAVAAGGTDFQPGSLTMFLDFVAYAPILPADFDASHFRREADYHERYRELAEHMMKRHQARLHWGKNANWWALNQPDWCGKSLFRMHRECSLADSSCDGGDYANRLERFRRVIKLMDPHGRFENSFARDVGLLPAGRRILDDETDTCP